MTAYSGQTRTTLGLLCVALWDTKSFWITIKYFTVIVFKSSERAISQAEMLLGLKIRFQGHSIFNLTSISPEELC
jgi:hypothetical protein